MNFKTGMLAMMVGIVIVGMVVSSVSAGNAVCKTVGTPSLTGYQCTIDTGYSCACGNLKGANCWVSTYDTNWCYETHPRWQWYTEW